MEQTLKERNRAGNTSGTPALKALANKVLNQNKMRNKPGAAQSKSVSPIPLIFSACGTNAEIDNVLYEHEERLVIAEYDGGRSPVQAERIAYLDAFVSALVTLPQESFLNSASEDWLDSRIKEVKGWLMAQGLNQSK